jgi:hypothetical protein
MSIMNIARNALIRARFGKAAQTALTENQKAALGRMLYDIETSHDLEKAGQRIKDAETSMFISTLATAFAFLNPLAAPWAMLVALYFQSRSLGSASVVRVDYDADAAAEENWQWVPEEEKPTGLEKFAQQITEARAKGDFNVVKL